MYELNYHILSMCRIVKLVDISLIDLQNKIASCTSIFLPTPYTFDKITLLPYELGFESEVVVNVGIW